MPSPNTQGEPHSLHLHTGPPVTIIIGSRNLSGFLYRSVHPAPVSTRAMTCRTFVGDQWTANSTCCLQSLFVPCRRVPQLSSYSDFQRTSPPPSQKVGTPRWSSSWTGRTSRVAFRVSPLSSSSGASGSTGQLTTASTVLISRCLVSYQSYFNLLQPPKDLTTSDS